MVRRLRLVARGLLSLRLPGGLRDPERPHGPHAGLVDGPGDPRLFAHDAVLRDHGLLQRADPRQVGDQARLWHRRDLRRPGVHPHGEDRHQPGLPVHLRPAGGHRHGHAVGDLHRVRPQVVHREDLCNHVGLRVRRRTHGPVRARPGRQALPERHPGQARHRRQGPASQRVDPERQGAGRRDRRRSSRSRPPSPTPAGEGSPRRPGAAPGATR